MSSNTPSRGVFGTLRDKLSKKSSSPSPDSPSWGVPSTAPPPYSAVAPAMSPAAATCSDDPYAFLGSFDTVFLIDDSSSMQGKSWKETRDVLQAIVPICAAHDQNGVDIYFLNRGAIGLGRNTGAGGYHNIKSAGEVQSIFNSVSPVGTTPTGTRIAGILAPYLRHYEQQVAQTGSPENCGVKPVNMIVITDGAPTDDPESVIINIARKLDKLEAPPHQVGIQFFQVGSLPGAAAALRELDDGLAEQGNGVRDMVDTVTWDCKSGSLNVLSADAILKVVLGAVIKRLDRKQMGVASGRKGR